MDDAAGFCELAHNIGNLFSPLCEHAIKIDRPFLRTEDPWRPGAGRPATAIRMSARPVAPSSMRVAFEGAIAKF